MLPWFLNLAQDLFEMFFLFIRRSQAENNTAFSCDLYSREDIQSEILPCISDVNNKQGG